MSDKKNKSVRTGVKKGGGPEPGYEWNVRFLSFLTNESKDLLTEIQFNHLVMQFKELASHKEPLKCQVVSLDRIEDYHELRDKGGVLNNLNVRVFFGIDKEDRAIVILGLITKQNNGPTPKGDRVRMRRRWRKYKTGDYKEV